MGWTWRRSASFGPVRLNFSSSGVGMSVGVRGARVSMGPRGTYVHVGAGGFRYSQRIDGTPPGPQPTLSRQPPALPPAQPATPGRSVEMLDPTQLGASTPDELLDEIRRKEQLVGSVYIAIRASAIALFLSLFLLVVQAPHWATAVTFALGLLGLVSLPWAVWSDRRARVVRLHYVFDPLGDKVQEGLVRLMDAFERAHAIWAVHTEHVHGDWKRNAGAGTSVGRRRVHVGWGSPSFIETNARVGFLKVDEIRLYFFPDRLLVFGKGGVSAVRYTDLSLSAGHVQFMEEAGVPRDAKVIGKTWRFVNKSGGPDLRFKNNYQIPIVLYGTLDVSALSGMRLSLQTSTDGLATSSVELMRVIQAAVRDLESRRASTARLQSLPSFSDDPPQLYRAGAQIFQPLGKVVSFQWLDGLPEWFTLAVWGILIALPPVALIIWFAQGGTAASIFLSLAFTAAGAGTGTLLYRYLGRAQQRRAEEEAAMKSRFRALLANELKSRPLGELDFSKLVLTSGISRRAADLVADDMFRKVADRFAQDGVITEKERGKLGHLSKALEMSSARADRIESEAKSDRYRQAVSEAIADGTVTHEEAYLLNKLRSQLGVEDSAWTAGNLVS
jgi:Protein of unknown function (DUF4236)